MSDRPLVAVVSGAARGIGAAVSRRLISQGWSVVGIDLDEPDGVTGAVVGDVTAEETWRRALAASRDLGDLHAVVNNAGAQGVATLLADSHVDAFDAVVAVNVRSAYLGTRMGLRELPAGGTVVNIASNAGSRGVPRYGAYVAAKHAVVGLTRTAAAEGGRSGIRVNAVAPGPTDTRIMAEVVERDDAEASARARGRMEAANPMGRFGSVDDVASAVTWLLGPDATYLNGAIVPVDGGLTAV